MQVVAATVIGAVVGATGYILASGNGPRVSSLIRSAAVSVGLVRKREPQWGDNWRSCEAAKTEGTWSISIGEPGYSSFLDRDGDGVACEPYHGR